MGLADVTQQRKEAKRRASPKTRQRVQRALSPRVKQQIAQTPKRAEPRSAAGSTPRKARRARPAHVPRVKTRPGFRSFARHGQRFEDGSRKESFSSRRFPYTDPTHVGWANFKVDADKVWPRVRRDYGGTRPEVHPGRKPGADGYAWRGRNEVYITPGGYMSPSKKQARHVLLHEIAHTRQSTRDLPDWVIEGGAEAFALDVGRRRLKQTGRTPRSYRPYVRQFRKKQRGR